MSSECVCHTDAEFCFYCEIYSPVEKENERLKILLQEAEVSSKSEEDRRCHYEILADRLAIENEQLRKNWAELREIVVTNATGGGGENINDYDIMLNHMDYIESEVSEDGAN